MPKAGEVVHIGPACGVQFAAGRDLRLRVIGCRTFGHTPEGMAWISGYVLDPATRQPTERREVLVVVAGIRRAPDRAQAGPAVRKTRNQPPIQRPRTPAITSGRTR